MSAERRRLVKLDAQGQELLRFATPFDVMDLVESEDDEGALLAVVGLDTGVLYLRPDGGAVGPFGARSFAAAGARWECGRARGPSRRGLTSLGATCWWWQPPPSVR